MKDEQISRFERRLKTEISKVEGPHSYRAPL